jgi:DNA gyrase subunit B
VADDAYGPESILVLEGLDCVRLRPAMYVGDTTDGTGLHHLLWEVLGNAIDEHLMGCATRIEVSIDGATLTVEDDGRGIPIELHPTIGLPAIELVLTRLHAGPTYDGHSPHVHIGRHSYGVGLAAVNALCERLHAVVHRDGRRFELAFARGERSLGLRDLGPSEGRGTRITLRPDATIFTDPTFDLDAVATRLRELAYLNPGLTLTLQGQPHHQPRGLAALVEHVRGASSLPIVHLRGEANGVAVEVAMTWGEHAQEPDVRSFVCQCPTVSGGTHVEGLWQGIADAVRQRWPLRAEAGPGRVAPRRGFVAAVHADLYHPSFGGPTKARLASDEARVGVREVVARMLPAWLAAHPHYEDALRQRLIGPSP